MICSMSPSLPLFSTYSCLLCICSLFSQGMAPQRLLLLPDSDAILAFPCSCDGAFFIKDVDLRTWRGSGLWSLMWHSVHCLIEEHTPVSSQRTFSSTYIQDQSLIVPADEAPPQGNQDPHTRWSLSTLVVYQGFLVMSFCTCNKAK